MALDAGKAKDDIDCWGPSGCTGCPYDANLQGDWDAEYEGQGWGWTWAHEKAEPFYACPTCKDE